MMMIPIEAFDGQRLAKLLADRGYRLKEMEEDILRPINVNPIEKISEVIEPKIFGQKPISVNASRPLEGTKEVTSEKSLERTSKKRKEIRE